MPLADLLFTTEEIARSGAEAVPTPGRNPESRAERIDVSEFDIIPLSTLWALLCGREWTETMLDAFETVYEKAGDGPWVYRVPADLVERLTGLADTGIPETARKWAQTEELEDIERRRPGTTRSVLSQIAALCRSAKEADRSVYLWMSL